MAIDYMIMPLSRYMAGDFISPAMKLAWELGAAYTQVRPDGVHEVPAGVPFGGPDAARNRGTFVDEVRSGLRPLFPTLPWDERSTAEPRFHRTDARGVELLERHVTAPCKPGFFDRLLGRSKAPPGMDHLFGTIFVPADLPRVVQIEAPLHGIVATIATALKFLDAAVPDEALVARDTLRAALLDAQELQLPMILDA